MFFNNTRLGEEDTLIDKGVKENCESLYVVSDDLFSSTQPNTDEQLVFDIDEEEEEEVAKRENEGDDKDSSEDEVDANTEYIREGEFDKVTPFDVVINVLYKQFVVMEIDKTTTMKDVLDWLVRNNRMFFFFLWWFYSCFWKLY